MRRQEQTEKRLDDFQNGIGMSKGVQNHYDDMIGDPHSDTALFLPNKKLEKKSGDLITAGCYQATNGVNGDQYFFSKTDGKIWKRAKSDGAYTLVRTNTNGAHKGARFYRGYIYYATDTFLGRYNLDATWNDNFNVLTSGSHAMVAFDLILYITNGNDVAQFDDADVFSPSGLDLPDEQDSVALQELGDDLLTLGNPGDYINDSKIFRWDTYSASWTIADAVKGVRPYAFIDGDNETFVVSLDGTIHRYDGRTLNKFSKIRNAAATSGHQLTTSFGKKPLIANGGRIYSLYSENPTFGLPIALVCEYVCSQGEGATIHSVSQSGTDLFVSWEYDGTFGVDEISATDYANSVIVTPSTEIHTIEVFFANLEGASSITLETKADGEVNWLSRNVVVDTVGTNKVTLAEKLYYPGNCQVRITGVSDGANRPIISSIKVD